MSKGVKVTKKRRSTRTAQIVQSERKKKYHIKKQVIWAQENKNIVGK